MGDERQHVGGALNGGRRHPGTCHFSHVLGEHCPSSWYPDRAVNAASTLARAAVHGGRQAGQ
jgi:hypothetical protein